MTYKSLILILTTIFIISGCGVKESLPPLATKNSLAAEVLQESGFDRALHRAGESWILAWKKSRPEVPDEFWRSKTPDLEINYGKALIDAHISAYAENFTEAELQDLLKFYRSPTGRKFKDFGERVMPALSQQVSTKMAKFNAAIQSRLQDNGYKP